LPCSRASCLMHTACTVTGPQWIDCSQVCCASQVLAAPRPSCQQPNRVPECGRPHLHQQQLVVCTQELDSDKGYPSACLLLSSAVYASAGAPCCVL
jgi:hypothetical protein